MAESDTIGYICRALADQNLRGDEVFASLLPSGSRHPQRSAAAQIRG